MEYLSYPSEVVLRFESKFDDERVVPFAAANWQWCFYFSAMYVILVLLGQRYMKNREPYYLRTYLCVWSTGLCVFSFWAVWRITPQLHRLIYLGGVRHAICDNRGYTGSTGTGLWTYLFPLSKLPELFDTAFIVLRKQKLSFLHVYHHVTVFIYCWYSYADPISTGILFGAINYLVHGVMYAYYAVKASGRHPPRWVARTITTIQISQMFVGLYINYLAITSIMSGKACHTYYFNIAMSLIMYASYVVLFGNFYYWTYIHKKARKPDASTGIITPDTTILANGHIIANGSGIAHGVHARQ